jgi:hypothetical protein
MPVFEFAFQPTSLLKDGAIIPVEIGVPTALASWLTQQAIPIPTSLHGYALIDTGASISAIDEQLLLQLEIAPIDSIPLQTPNGESNNFVYPARVSFPAIELYNYAMTRVAGCKLDWTTDDGKKVVMLIGREMLSEFRLLYEGRSNTITLAY